MNQKISQSSDFKHDVQTQTCVIFKPVAQNTVVRPMAEAVCIVLGGDSVQYIDTADHKEKSITLSDLHGLKLQTNVKGESIDAYQVALKAKQEPVQIRVDVNDVQIFISKKTTVKQAMAEFYKKIALRQYE